MCGLSGHGRNLDFTLTACETHRADAEHWLTEQLLTMP